METECNISRASASTTAEKALTSSVTPSLWAPKRSAGRKVTFESSHWFTAHILYEHILLVAQKWWLRIIFVCVYTFFSFCLQRKHLVKESLKFPTMSIYGKANLSSSVCVDVDNSVRCFHKRVLHDSIKQITSYPALWNVENAARAQSASILDQDGKRKISNRFWESLNSWGIIRNSGYSDNLHFDLWQRHQ